ncbi:MAG: hypothetical protein GEV08_24665 [Acidimicrobiia bacterium]|nr:hypothetical protein [Acidimicrobiia bacterium]
MGPVPRSAATLRDVAPLFRYDDDLLERFPTTRGGVVHVRGAANGASPTALADELAAEQEAARHRLDGRGPADLPSIAAWRRAFSAFGVEPTKYRNAAEALLRRVVKRGDLPAINLLVDVGNLVSVRHALPVAVFDVARAPGGLVVRTATGEESFDDLGGTEATRPVPGEVVFVDEDGAVAARRWCWRQSTVHAARLGTTEALITVEAHHEGAEEDVAAALASFRDLFARHQPSVLVTTAELSPNRPAFHLP